MKQFFDALNRKNIKDLAVIALEQKGYTEAAIELKDTTRLTEAAIRRTYELVKHRDEINGEDPSVIAAEEEISKACADANEAQAVQEEAQDADVDTDSEEIFNTIDNLVGDGKLKKAKKLLKSHKSDLDDGQIKALKKAIKKAL